MKDKSIKAKVEKTNIERYGSVSPFGSEDVHKKSVEKFVERYGAKSYNVTDAFKEKSLKTLNDRYGVSSALQNDEVKSRMQRTCREKAYDRIISRLNGVAEPLFSKEEFVAKNYRDRTAFQLEMREMW